MTASLSDEEIEDRYFLLGRMEILSILNDLIYRREPVMVNFNGGRDFFITTLLEARPEALVFDLGSDVKTNQRLGESPGCIFVARLNGIHIQFSGGSVHRFSWGGSDAFWVALPERVVRRQRRESYRIVLPVAKPMMVQLFEEDGGAGVEWPAHDLSVSGLGLQVVGMPDLETGQKIARIRLALPKQRPINCAAVVRHVTLLADRQGSARYRVGLSFAGLPPALGVAIQRFITKMELERRGLLDGDGAGRSAREVRRG